MHLSSHAATHIGRRKNNEDAYARVPDLGLYGVADGMGGYEGGEVASGLAVKALTDFLARVRRDPDGTWPCREDKQRSLMENLVRAAALEAHRAIAEQRAGLLSQMGATLAMVVCDGTRLAVAHVGDSRVYRLRGGVLTQLTRDHSVWEELKAAGRAPPERANFQFKNQITRALGIEGSHRADSSVHELLAGDTFLMCSDGLYDPVGDEAIATALAATSPEEACETLVVGAYDAGGSDNITGVVLRAG